MRLSPRTRLTMLINAYEDGDDLVVDICPTPYINLRTYLELEKQLNPPKVSKGISTTADQEFTR